MDFLNDLNPEQKKAVIHTKGPLLILAGAGSGKTRVLTYKVAYILRTKTANARNIIAITFTNKAAREMKERVEQLLPGKKGLLISTFHSACVRFLRQDIDKLGYNRNFNIFDTQDQKVVIRECIAKMNLDEKKYTPQSVLGYIGRAKDILKTPDECSDNAKDIRERTMAGLYKLYQKRLKENNALDFDDLIMKTVELFRQNPSVLSKYQERYQYILVDEYQDTNRAQYELIRMLAAKHRNLCVVGDDDQSIYGFRGADIRNILDFEEDFPDATVIRLEQNYRSSQNILDAANNVIDHNFGRKRKTLWTENPSGHKIGIASLENEHDEAFFIAREIENMILKDGMEYKDFAVLYRTNAQSRVIEEVMVKMGIPYRMIGGMRFYERREIKDLLAYLRAIANPYDDVSLMRIINVPKRGIGEATIDKLNNLADENNLRIFDIIKMIEDTPLAAGVVNRVSKFRKLMIDFIDKSETMTISDLIRYVLDETGYMKELTLENSPESISRIENLQEFVGAAIEYENRSSDIRLEDFLAELALVSDVDKLEDGEQAVVLMTLHGAKGLEFPVVFLAGMDEGIFPHARCMLDADELEEERRLCYVGITRAKQRLYLTRAWQRSIYGNTSYYTPSRFIDEIPDELVEDVSFGAGGSKVNSQKHLPVDDNTCFSQETSYKTDDSQVNFVGLAPGSRVRHSKWGEGIVLDVQGIDEDAEISIDFKSVGVKHLISKYAPLVRIS
ncbi:MAG TPA: DNA helicase PcrA [Thermoanaerobacterales bacterium]|nr:DNA helicase PcrA [Thermoanaerobacterales bacterium]